MTLRKILILPLIISLCFFAYYSSDVLDSIGDLMHQIKVSPSLLVILGLAIILQIVGHIVRAYKARYILMEVKESSTRFQFRALTIGYLFNTVLPFRLGELVRSRIIADAMNLSFSLAFVLIIFERAVDALLLSIFGLILFLVFQPGVSLALPLTLLFGGTVLMFVILLVALPDRHMRALVYKSSRLLNNRLKDSSRFKAWSVIYGLQRIFKMRILIKYLCFSIASWILYGLSIFVVVQYFFRDGTFQKLMATLAPYFGMAIPAGPANLGSYSANASVVLNALPNVQGKELVFTLLTWAILVIPTATIGLALLLFKTRETFWRRVPQTVSIQSLHNKLDRSGDISAEMSVFLENYFAGNTLSTIVHRLEVKGNFRLLKYFKGGSDAITILVSQQGKTIVKKIIPLEFEDRLRAQYDWLAEYRSVPGVVQVYDELRADDYYTIDMSFSDQDISLFEYSHSRPLKKTQEVFENVWEILNSNVYTNISKQKLHAKNREAYIRKHIYDCLEKAGVVDPEILRATESEKLIVNGKEYDNIRVILDKIRQNKRAWNDIATYAESPKVHGDVIVDNLLVDKKTDKALIIDPAPDGNIINGRVFDFGKNMQSLYCGYEFLLRDESTVYLREDNHIDYTEVVSVQYAGLCEYVRGTIAPKYLSDAEQRAMLFHAGVLFIRRLKHQVYYTPGNALKFYAVGVKTLNDFLAQYD
jgi:hypothetical protein